MSALDWIMLFAIGAIWLILMVNVILVVAGYFEYMKMTQQPEPSLPPTPPMVSVMVPAHNEGVVIVKTVESLLRFDYPQDRYEIIVINDNSSDNSAALLRDLQHRYPDRQLHVINTDAVTGGKGKSNALNIGLTKAQGSVLAIYDADNTPEFGALRILVSELMADDGLGAVIGKFRTRNKQATWLTRFINIELSLIHI